MTREAGFYWVRLATRYTPGSGLQDTWSEPKVAEWQVLHSVSGHRYEGWEACGSDHGVDEENIEVISERLTPPD